MPARAEAFVDEAAGAFVCDFVERLPRTSDGKPLRLFPWQRDVLMEFYSTLEMSEDTGARLRKYWYLYLEIPKKNGKSELAAALGLYHLFADGELNAGIWRSRRKMVRASWRRPWGCTISLPTES